MKKHMKPLIIGVGLATVTLFTTTLLLFKPEPVKIGLGEEKLSSYEFSSRYENIKKVYANLNIDVEKNEDTRNYIRGYVAKQMVAEQVIKEIAEENKVQVESKEIKAFMDNYKKSNAFGSTSGIRGDIVENHLLKVKLEKKLTTNMKIEEQELKSYYELHKDSFKLPESAEVSQIVVKSKEDAEKIISDYRKGKTFEQLIKDYSSDEESKQKNGKMGIVMKSDLSEKMASVIFSTRAGDISEILEVNTSFIIFKVEKVNNMEYLKLEEVKEEVERQLRGEKTKQYLEKRVDEIFEAEKFYISV